jgi:hypothetical protein
MKLKKTLALLLALATLAGCSAQGPQNPSDSPDVDNAFIEQTPVIEIVDIEDEAVALSDAPAPAASIVLKPVASGTQTQSSGQATIDYSNAKDGYVMVKASSGKKLMVRVFGPSYAVNETKYTYTLPSGEWTTFPLSDGNGDYKVTVYENVSGTSYSTMLSASFSVTLTDEFAPFLRPNQYVNYENATNSIEKAAELTQGITDPLEMVGAVYDYVVNNVTYDKQKAQTVKSGYLPVLDDTLATGKGICFDYAALMVGMLRSQGVPCKLVVGYASKAYHAWVSVWTEESGWVDGAIFFDGSTWQRMDPTFISSGKNSASIQKYVGNGSNYNAMYLY